MVEPTNQIAEPTARLADICKQLKNSLSDLRSAIESEARIITLSTAVGKTRDTLDVQQRKQAEEFHLGIEETSEYQEMRSLYERRQDVTFKVQGLLEEALWPLRTLALSHPIAKTAVDLVARISTVPINQLPLHRPLASIDIGGRMNIDSRNPESVAGVIDLIERVLASLESDKPTSMQRRRQRKTENDLDRIKHQVSEICREAERQREKLRDAELCKRLDARNVALPQNTRWGREYLSWTSAHKTSSGTVATWLSRVRTKAR